MSTSLVSARVPAAKKEAAAGVLSSLGATTSDLINDAFDYVIENRVLPGAGGDAGAGRSIDRLATFVARSTLDIAWDEGAGEDFYKHEIREGKAADYESLA